MRTLLLVFHTLFIVSCRHRQQANPGDDPIPVSIPAQLQPLTDDQKNIKKLILVSSGQISPAVTSAIYGCEFDIVADKGDTVYLATSDTHFFTPEGYRTGDLFSNLPKKIQKGLVKEQGWGYFYILESGWQLGFCEGNSCTDNYPSEKSVVRWVFKRK